MSASKNSLFITADGKNVVFTFINVSSLFLLWDFVNGVIDVMERQFYEHGVWVKHVTAYIVLRYSKSGSLNDPIAHSSEKQLPSTH